MSEPLADLETVLHAAPPAELAALPPDAIADLAAAIRTARREQGAALEAAGEQALTHVPRLLRGPVKKVLFR